MFDLLLHPDRFWVKTFWPITVAALCVWLGSKVISHPNAGRWLWRACMLKLLAVSLVPISLAIPFLPAQTTATTRASQQREVPPNAETVGTIRLPTQQPSRGGVNHKRAMVAPDERSLVITARGLCEAVWYCGFGLGLIWFGAQWLSTRRRLRRVTLISDERSNTAAGEMAQAMGLRRVPPIARSGDARSPQLVGLFRPTLIFPAWSVDEADDEDVRLILAHEFAHAKCRDLFWNLIAGITTTLFFFHPLVWFARRRLLIAQETAADLLTLRVTGVSVARYANLVMRIVEKSSCPRTRPVFVVTAGFTFRELKERIEKMHSRPKSNALVVSLAIVAVSASLLPWHADFIRPAAAADDPPAREQAAKVQSSQRQLSLEYYRSVAVASEMHREGLKEKSDFPYIVRFQQGATRLPAGDKIVITEVKGTAETMTPGNIYLVRGTYKLASHDRASLSAFTTAMDSANGFGSTLKVQTALVKKGEGTFTLYLPMSCRGWPHVSFYPAEGGGDIGGTYFGTGDSVLKKWWGEK
jgi:beta-lactamase regulating signal transducer with metallopeptidase domain